MIKRASLAVLLSSSLMAPAFAAPPAPPETGVQGGPEVAQANQSENTGTEEGQQSASEDPTAKLQQQITSLETEIKALRTALEKATETQKELETLRGKVAIMEGDTAGLLTRMKAQEDEKTKLMDRVKVLEADNATLQESRKTVDDKLAKLETQGPEERTTAKPVFVPSAVRFYNPEGRPLQMNVNGVWHTLKAGENDIWVPYGPVHIYRYTGAEPKMFWKWKSHQNGFLMEFDVGTPEEASKG